MLTYRPDRRSMTGGKGAYSMDFHGYETAHSHRPFTVAAQIKRGHDS
jgi:translation elongation factor EF-G